ISKVIISTKEYLAAIIPHHEGLILSLLKYDNEIKKLDEFDFPTKEPSAYKINKKEMEIAKQLVKAMTSKWQPKKYGDEYQQAIKRWVDATVKHLPHKKMKKEAKIAPPKSVNFIALLKKSLSADVKGKTKSKKMQRLHARTTPSGKSTHVTKH